MSVGKQAARYHVSYTEFQHILNLSPCYVHNITIIQ